MEKLDFPMKNLQALGKGEILAKRFRETGKGKDDFFSYRHTVTQEQYSFKGMSDVDAYEQSHLIVLFCRYTDMQSRRRRTPFRAKGRNCNMIFRSVSIQ